MEFLCRKRFELGGLMDAKSLAVTLIIARSKINQNGYT